MFTDTITTRDVLTFSLHLQNNIKQTAETEISTKVESSKSLILLNQETRMRLEINLLLLFNKLKEKTNMASDTCCKIYNSRLICFALI